MALPRPLRSRRAIAAAAAAAVAASVAALAPGISDASSHREAPLIAGLPQLDNTDVYAFVSPDKDKQDTVTLIANWIPLEEPNGGPNFYPFADGAAYDIKIDNDGDANPDITYRWTFASSYQNRQTFLYNTDVVTSLTDPDLNFRQTYNLDVITRHGKTRLITNAPAAPSNTGPASMPNYKFLADSAVTTRGKLKSFAGQADESFFLDLRVFDLLYGGNLSEVGQDTLTGYNVNTIALQVPKSVLALNNNATRNPVIGVWSTTSRARKDVVNNDGSRDAEGKLVQVSRLGMPLVNEVVIPVADKDRFNASKPVNDANPQGVRDGLPDGFGSYVTNPIVPTLIQNLYGIPAPKTPRADLVEVFLKGVCQVCGPVGKGLKADLNSQLINKDVNPMRFRPAEMLRLNMSIPPNTANPSRLGVLGGDLAGFPNGRRLADDVLDITVQAAEGVLLPGTPAAVAGLGDGVNANDMPFRTVFPYIALPSNKAVNTN